MAESRFVGPAAGITITFHYGMKLRGFSPGAQPMDGFVERYDDEDGKYYDILVYNRRLTDEEVDQYDLEGPI